MILSLGGADRKVAADHQVTRCQKMSFWRSHIPKPHCHCKCQLFMLRYAAPPQHTQVLRIIYFSCAQCQLRFQTNKSLFGGIPHLLTQTFGRNLRFATFVYQKRWISPFCTISSKRPYSLAVKFPFLANADILELVLKISPPWPISPLGPHPATPYSEE